MEVLRGSAAPAEKRAYYYKIQADPHMLAAQGYEHEGDQTKADACWAKYDEVKTEIRTKYPDE